MAKVLTFSRVFPATVAEIKKKFLNEFVWYGNPDKTFEWFEPYLSNPAEPATEKEPVRIPTRDEIYAKGAEYADSQSNGEINAYYDGYTTCLNNFSAQTKGLDITDEEIEKKAHEWLESSYGKHNPSESLAFVESAKWMREKCLSLTYKEREPNGFLVDGVFQKYLNGVNCVKHKIQYVYDYEVMQSIEPVKEE